ncbi:MAG: hypothetical protein GJ680_16080 [Alteromonadaceae bacterium]|nr:hypothetical protein [Alteromonadaceae bacterium]
MGANKPLWHGVLLVAGGAIGAGMFALPMVSAGAWLLWSSLALLSVWALTYLASSLLAKVNLALVASETSAIDSTSSFDSLVSHTAGKKWAWLNNISIVFIMMILMYAYITAGASIIGYTLQLFAIEFGGQNKSWLSLLFSSFIAFIVWLGTSRVSQVSLVFLIAMTVSFVLAVLGILPAVDSALFNVPDVTLPYIPGVFPVFVTAFACAGLVPTLVRHYPNAQTHVFKSLLGGTLLALVVYLIWLVVTLGSIGREGFVSVIQSGSNIAELVNGLVSVGVNASVQRWLTLFSHFAIMTSFLSVSLGLVHFMQDRLKLDDSKRQKLIAVLFCFVLPTLGSFFFPYGFVTAIGFAGLFVAFSFFILPGLMGLALVRDGLLDNAMALIVISITFGLLILGLKVSSMLGWLPKFGLS